MQTHDFLARVWPAEGVYCIAILAPSVGGITHKTFSSISDAAAYAEKQATAKDVYFATHALRDGTRRSKLRAQDNARSCKTLFFDIDVDPENPAKYTTQSDAVVALIKFVNDNNLHRPMVVSSGGGLHVYWVFEEELDSHGEWLTQAKRLKQLAIHHKLKIDVSRTTDQSSILRVAGTSNFKHGQRRPVEVKSAGEVIPAAQWSARILTALDAASVPPETSLGSNTSKFEFDKPPPSMASLLKCCAQMRRLVTLFKTGGTEPEWYWGIGVVKFTENGRINVHKMSSQNPYYRAADTDAKIDQWTKPPTTCAKLREVCGSANEHLCAGCKHFGDGASSPAWAATLNDTAPPPVVKHMNGTAVEHLVPNPPMPYQRRRNGGIEILMQNKEGKDYSASIYPYDLYPLERSSNLAHETEQQIWRFHPPHSTARDFSIEASTFVDDRALQVRLANNGIYPEKFPEVRKYMSAYIQELQRLNPTTTQHNQLGWTEEHDGFVLPTKLLQAGVAPKPVSLSHVIANSKTIVATRGTLEKQVELMQFYSARAYIPNQFFILSSLGSALLFATGHAGAIVNATGEAGASKSTALYAAASFWGPPKKFTLNGTGEGATPLGRSARRDILSNLPLCLDEITHIAVDVAKNFAMNATQPGSRIRLKRDGSQVSVTDNERASITMTTSNRSLYSILQEDNAAGTAGSVRVLELEFGKRGIHKAYEAETFLRSISENYGHIGEAFIQAVVTMRDKVVNRVIATFERLSVIAEMREEERFWFVVAAVNLVAGELAVRLGLLSWRISLIEEWFFTVQLPFMRGIVHDELVNTSPIAVLTDYLERINGDMVKTTKAHGGNISNVIQGPRGELLADYDMDNQIIYVLKSGFMRWCKHAKISRLSVLRRLHDAGIVPTLHVQRVLGAGTSHAKGRSYCFVVSMAHPDICETTLPTTIQPAGFVVIPGGRK